MAKNIVSKISKAVTKSINEKKYTADVKMSDETLDRDKEIILLDAYKKYLPRFMEQPVIADSHRIETVLDGLGRYENIEIVPNEGLFARAHYFVNEEKELTPDKQTVRWAWVLVMNGLGAYSVRFIAHKAVEGADLPAFEGVIPDSVIEQGPRRVFTEVELIETSQVLVPANPSAMVSGKCLEGVAEAEREAMEGIIKGVFDKGIMRMPKKTFYIDAPKKRGGDSSLLFRVSFEGEAFSDYEKFLKSLEVAEVEAVGEEEDGDVIEAEVLEEEEAELEVEEGAEEELAESEEEKGLAEGLEELEKGLAWVKGQDDVSGLDDESVSKLEEALKGFAGETESAVDIENIGSIGDEHLKKIARCLDLSEGER